MSAPDVGFNISTFKSQGLTLGGARPSLFTVLIPIIPAVVQADPTSTDKLSFTCRAGSLPAAAMGVIEVPYFGRKIKIKGDRTFADWSIQVMNDEDFLVRSMFEKWSNSMNAMESNVEAPGDEPLDAYKTDMLIAQYSKAGQMIRRYKMVGAWPSNVDAIEVDWDTTNQIETFRVTIAYDYWLPDLEVGQNSFLQLT